MKKLIPFLVLPLLLFAQEAEQFLNVKYEMYYKFDPSKIRMRRSRMSSGDMQKMMKDMMKKPTIYNLTMNRTVSKWENVERVSNNQSRGFGARWLRGGPAYKVKDFETGKYYSKENFFGKEMIVEDSLAKLKWNLSREKREILGYQARKATAALNDSTEIEAWYAPKVNYTNGPDVYDGLPGLILELKTPYRRGTAEYFAVEITVPKEVEDFEKPQGSKVVSQKEFDEMREKQIQKFREMYGGGVSTGD